MTTSDTLHTYPHMRPLLSAARAALCALSLLCAAQAGATARYIFYFIGDGMGMGHVYATETYRRTTDPAGRPLTMLRFPVASQVRTHSADSPITDSAAAGTALSTGRKTRNYMVGMTPDSLPARSLAADLMDAGYATGLVTTVPGDDATPAAFYAHVPGRSQSAEIGRQAITSGIDFFGAPMFRAMYDADGTPTDWTQRMRADGGYETLTATAGDVPSPRRPGKGRVLMTAAVTAGQQAGYTIDSIPGAVSLATLTQACLDHLEATGRPFFIMAEAGNIDWAAHANDGGAVIKETLAFQQAIDVAYDFYLRHPGETLIIVTADHDTGGMALGRQDNRKNPQPALAEFQRISKERFTDACTRMADGDNDGDGWPAMKQFMADNLGFWQGVPLTDSETLALHQAYDATFVDRTAASQQTLYKDFNAFTVKVYDILNRHIGTGFTSTSHTGNPVPLYALGDDAHLFSFPLDNTQIPGLILKAAGVIPSSR